MRTVLAAPHNQPATGSEEKPAGARNGQDRQDTQLPVEAFDVWARI
ncbi:hypothetical protein [Streptomyces sp. DZ1-3]